MMSSSNVVQSGPSTELKTVSLSARRSSAHNAALVFLGFTLTVKHVVVADIPSRMSDHSDSLMWVLKLP